MDGDVDKAMSEVQAKRSEWSWRPHEFGNLAFRFLTPCINIDVCKSIAVHQSDHSLSFIVLRGWTHFPVESSV